MKWESILFDLDGTLLNTSDGLEKSIEYTVNKMMLPKVNSNELKSVLGPLIYESLKSYYELAEKWLLIQQRYFEMSIKINSF